MTARGANGSKRGVLITRSEEDCAEWAAQFASRGFRPESLPCISYEPIDTPAVRAALAEALPTTDWLVLTSRRGVEALTSLASKPLQLHCRVAVVGATTAAAAKAALGRVDIVGAGTAAALGATLVDIGELERRPRVLLAVAENAGDALERAVAAAGATCTRVDVYRTVPAPPMEPRRPLSSLRVDNVVLASPSAVAGFVNQVSVDTPVEIVTIGPSTTAAAQRAGLVVAAQAREPSLDGVLEAMQWRN